MSKHKRVRAYFSRDLAELEKMKVDPGWLAVLSAHWSGDLEGARVTAEALASAGRPGASFEGEMLHAEALLLRTKLGLPYERPSRETLATFGPAARAVVNYAIFLDAFFTSHRLAWRCLACLMGFALIARNLRLAISIGFQMAHLLVMAGWTRSGFLACNILFMLMERAGPTLRFSEPLAFACFPYTAFLAGRLDLLENIVSRCRSRVPNDPFYQSIHSASLLYAAAYTGNLARAEVIGHGFQKRCGEGQMTRYWSLARILPLLPIALRGYGHILREEFDSLVASHVPDRNGALINSHFFRASALIAISLGEYTAAEEYIARADRYRSETGSFHAWKRVDSAIADMARRRVRFDPNETRLFRSVVPLDSPATLGTLLLETITAMPLALSGGPADFEKCVSILIAKHLECQELEMRDEPLSASDAPPQLRLLTRYLVLKDVSAGRMNGGRALPRRPGARLPRHRSQPA